ncbi:FtsK/SpoIIIE domain-containing protein, partial [Actinomadura sp. 7K507]|uniref:FtsK/SpoIIIE domain-containing protein n=1 Tax=Actinomadura sp. 7K507 TaxID=2530365 RepID=UPI00104D08F7
PETRSHLAPQVPSTTAPPDLLDLLGTPVDELIGDEWGRPPHPTLIGVGEDGDPVWVDILRGGRFGPHGMITGPRRARDALLRTIVFSLALSHSPNVVNFAFADFSGGASFVGLGYLPHVVTAIHPTSAESPVISRLHSVVETERRRREAVLQNAGIPRWNDYQTAVAEGRPLDPLPALIVIIDNTGPLLEARPDLIEPIMALCGERPAQGIRFVFCSAEETALLADLVAWRIEIPGGTGPGSASLQVYGEPGHPASFRPAHVSLDASDPIVEAMRRRGPRASRLKWPDEPAPPPQTSSPPPETSSPPPQTSAPGPGIPEFDVLRLNGGGTSGMFEETWALPAIEPRDPAIGYDPDGNVVTLYPLDISSGIPHGLIVGETAARQHTVRNITLALAANYSPEDLTFAFAGLGEHPLGEPIDLPHVRFSDDELLGRPRRLQAFIDYLSGELDARAASRSADAPGLVVFADVSLTFPSSRPEAGEALLKLAQRGRALGVQLLVSSSTVEGTTIWNRFLPLLGWRIAAGRMPPSLQRVLGQASLPFPDERTAYLLAGGGRPRQFTLAPDTPRAAIDDFVQRTDHRFADVTLPDLLMTGHDAEDRAVMDLLRRLYILETRAARSGESRPRHLIYGGTDLRIARAATLYGRLLAGLGVLAHGNMREGTADWTGHVAGDPGASMADLFRESRGGVLLLHVSRAHDASTGVGGPGFQENLRSLVQQHGEDPVVILWADPEQVLGLRQADSFFTDRFDRIGSFEQPPPPDPQSRPAASSDRRIPIGVDAETHEPVLLDFDVDRHLLISGPPGSGKTFLMGGIIDRLVSQQAAGAETLVYVLDGTANLPVPSSIGSWEEPGVRYTDSPEEFGTLLNEAIWGTRARLLSGQGPEVYVFVAGRNRLLTEDPLAPVLDQLGAVREHGLHLVLLRQRISFGEPLDPLVDTLREFGAPVLLTGSAGGREANLWEVPEALRGFLPQHQALLAHLDRQRLIRLPEPS